MHSSVSYAMFSFFYRKESDMDDLDDLVKLTEVMLMPNDIVSQVNFAYRVLSIAAGNRNVPPTLADALKEGFGDISIFNLLKIALEGYRLEEGLDINDAVEQFCINYLKSDLQKKKPLKDSNGRIAQYWDSVHLTDIQEAIISLLLVTVVAMVDQVLLDRNIGKDAESLCLIVEEAQKTLYTIGVYLDVRDHDTVSP
nr:MAG TPA: hypothetical protein [Caudoviricetes sp.]